MKAVTYDTLTFPAKNAVLTLPSGEKQHLSSFKHQPIKFSYDTSGIESTENNGEEFDAVRFYPKVPGKYSLKTDNDEIEIEVTDSGLHGYVSVSKKDPGYFRWSDGTPLNLFGINLAFISPVPHSAGYEFGLSKERCYLGLRQYERWFKQCRDNGVNMARIWLGHEYFSPDTEDADKFISAQFSKIEALLALARKYDIVLKLTIDQFRFFDYDRIADSPSPSDDIFRKFNKRLYKNGKRCESSEEWMSERIWRDAWIEKLKNFAVRFSGHPSIFGIELWNEMNCVSHKWLRDWNEEMLTVAKELFPEHLIMNSLGSFDADEVFELYENFCWDKSSVKQVHRYIDQGAKYEVCHTSGIDLVRDACRRLMIPEKPFIFAETGAVNPCHCGTFSYYTADHRGTIFCDVVYTPLFCGSASCGNIWHWDERYVEAKNLYPYFKPLVSLCEDIIFDEEDFKPKVYETDDVILLLLCGKSKTIGYLRNRQDNWDVTLRDLKEASPANAIFDLDISGDLNIQKIWNDETGTLTYENGKLNISGLNHGLLIKFQ